ncbi:hypothetical protein GLAREA_11798 [Glarea lozoyensis ATCC 20868]|uniref:Uncharacterized protein n=1 Tax=Glarea lozoyensis (strain ATCC 20868 / MF5171) TaxID=1116229 RepID=S3CFE8_GLAL2|nr:uncharacterized protein GLAREA_11798 [Glarea lozoyensis ATCC 20868]EPE25217.1 hypothetical protein GLAREA_11798 [Glarea lozoyensis ATCC 20868]
MLLPIRSPSTMKCQVLGSTGGCLDKCFFDFSKQAECDSQGILAGDLRGDEAIRSTRLNWIMVLSPGQSYYVGGYAKTEIRTDRWGSSHTTSECFCFFPKPQVHSHAARVELSPSDAAPIGNNSLGR